MDIPPQAPFTPADEEHLRLISIFHLVAGILYVVGGFFPILHLIFGLMMIFNPDIVTGNQGEPPPAFFGYFFVVMAVILILAAWTMGALTIYSGRCIQRRQSRMYSLVISGLNCCLFPVGTALGVFTFIVLGRPGVRAEYENKTRI